LKVRISLSFEARCSAVTENGLASSVYLFLPTLIDMSHTYTVLLVHCVFSTKNRRRLIPDRIQSRLWSFVGGIARKNGFKALVVGGTEDHMHVLLSLPATIPVAKAAQLLKGASSRWMNESVKNGFAWQEGYGAFTIGISQKPDTVAYIQQQREHHHKRDFRQEFLAFLKKHGVEYDPGYVWR
jgi:putative transposase